MRSGIIVWGACLVITAAVGLGLADISGARAVVLGCGDACEPRAQKPLSVKYFRLLSNGEPYKECKALEKENPAIAKYCSSIGHIACSETELKGLGRGAIFGGTGSVIKPPGAELAVIVSTAHGVVNRKSNQPKAFCNFYPATHPALAFKLGARLIGNWDVWDFNSGRQGRNDWMVARIDQAILKYATPVPLLPLEKALDAKERNELRLTLFSYDWRKGRAKVTDGCSELYYRAEPVLIHDCNAVEGDSGSLLFAQTATGMGAIGFHSFEMMDSGDFEPGPFDIQRRYNGGQPFVGELVEAIKEAARADCQWALNFDPRSACNF